MPIPECAHLVVSEPYCDKSWSADSDSQTPRLEDKRKSNQFLQGWNETAAKQKEKKKKGDWKEPQCRGP